MHDSVSLPGDKKWVGWLVGEVNCWFDPVVEIPV